MRPESQIKSYIEDALRSSVPKLTLDELFEKKDEIALEVQKQVAEEMSTYGYIIVKTLITKVGARCRSETIHERDQCGAKKTRGSSGIGRSRQDQDRYCCRS